MINLQQFDDEDVIVTDIDGRTYSGHVGDYIAPIHNENGKESIVLDDPTSRYPIEFYEDDIKSITIVETAKKPLAAVV